jgi:hypothetical protein
MKDTTVNAGVGAQNGFALQRNMALFILLDNYEDKFKGKKYFVSLEHHDDFLFCFLDDDDKTNFIEVYQSKKKSTAQWKITKELGGILYKLLNIGLKLNNDEIIKSDDYSHYLKFSSNANIKLEATLPKESSSKTTTFLVNEENINISFLDLNIHIKNKIKNKITNAAGKQTIIEELKELDNLHFMYVEFSRTNKEQKNQLYGKIYDVFGDQIVDQKAALDTILSLFNDIELTYNQGNKARLLDLTKRVTSPQINNAINIITTRSKAFDFWRTQKDTVAKNLKIKHVDRDKFEIDFDSAFDLFKSLEQAEHNKILSYVRKNYGSCKSFTDIDIVIELNEMYKKYHSTSFSDLTLKAIIFAAFFEVTYKKEISNG